jgi:hypothetical protein
MALAPLVTIPNKHFIYLLSGPRCQDHVISLGGVLCLGTKEAAFLESESCFFASCGT